MSSWAYWAILCFFSVFSTHAVYSHAVQENTAKILTRHGALELALNIHGNQWTEKFKVSDLDDQILLKTRLLINKKVVGLKLRIIEQQNKHYKIVYLAKEPIPTNVEMAELTLPSELGNVLVTFLRASTKMVQKSRGVMFRF